MFLFSFYSCQNKSSEIVYNNDSIIAPRKMVEILVDVHLAEAALNIKQLNNQDIKYYTYLYYSNIFKKHNIDIFLFKRSLEYYLSHPEYFEDIYNEVMGSLIQMQSFILNKHKGKHIDTLSPHHTIKNILKEL
ncbi:MAG TPA: DUF4296 domain-containing protein [Bacteroidales bacterium]|nr:DUF4296 domain-containing protein [Bacteroidales bacterium]